MNKLKLILLIIFNLCIFNINKINYLIEKYKFFNCTSYKGYINKKNKKK